MKTFSRRLPYERHQSRCTRTFPYKLDGVSDPEQKRKIIGNEFIYVFDDEATKLEGIDFLLKEHYIQILLKVGQHSTND